MSEIKREEGNRSFDIVLIDGPHMAFRAFYAFSEFTTYGGTKSGVGYGVLKMLDRIRKTYTPRRIIFCWGGKHNWRKRKYEWYKSSRFEPEKEYITQVHDLKIMLERIGISQYYADEFEADDLLAFFARGHSSKGRVVLIVTGDHDLRQEVTDMVFVLAPNLQRYDTLFDIELVKEKHGVSPGLLVDLWALTGDKGDDIDGVKRVGVKTALKIVKNNGPVENLYFMKDANEKIEGVTPFIQKQVYGHMSKILMNKELIKLAEGLEKEDVQQWVTDSKMTLEDLFRKYEYKTFLNEMSRWAEGWKTFL